MNRQSVVHTLTFLAMAAAGLALGALPARAVPSFARQTGLPCEECHTSFPELTTFGRHFKLNGYTLTTTSTVGAPGANVELNATPPLSYMLMVGYTRTSKAQADTALPTHSAQNGSILLPQQLSLFYAGRISPKIGAFTQITYTQPDDHFSMDNADIRAANKVEIGNNSLVYGITVNNNPTVQDLWNSTPAWGFPFAGSDQAPGPAAAALLDGTLGQQVAGVGGYAAYNTSNGLAYAEYTLYRSAVVGAAAPLDSTAGPDAVVVKGFAPYYRLAYEMDFGASSWEIGTLGMSANIVPSDNGQPVDTTPTDKVTDSGLDTQLQLVSNENSFGVKGLYLKEKQSFASSNVAAGVADNASDNLTTTRITGTYNHRRNYGVNLQVFNITGTSDASLWGTGNGSPDSAGEVLELAYTPWLNTRFSLQYTKFSKLDGTADNASDSNSVFLLGWFMF